MLMSAYREVVREATELASTLRRYLRYLQRLTMFAALSTPLVLGTH